QQVLEQDLERIRQIVDSVADGIESIDTVALPAHGERLARAEAVSHREPRMGSEWKTRKPELYQARAHAPWGPLRARSAGRGRAKRLGSSERRFARPRPRTFDRRAAQAALAVVQHHVLAGRHGPLRGIEVNVDRVAAAGDDRARLVRLAVAGLRRATKLRTGLPRRGRPVDPMHLGRKGRVAEQGRVVRALRDDQLVALEVLPDDIPRRVRPIGDAADAEPVTLAERVERESPMPSDRLAVDAADRAGPRGDVAREEFAERTLADEADPRAVLLLRDRQVRGASDLAHLVLRELAERKQHVAKIVLGDGVQEIALVLARIDALQQIRAAGRRVDAGVVTGREPLPAAPLGVAAQDAELDLAIAEHVGIGRAAPLGLRDEMREDAF